jgi:predicted O-methyltransferase YrrM
LNDDDDPRWAAVDEYIGAALLPNDSALEAALADSAAAGLPAIQVSPAQGQFLFLFARALRAQRILEIGTLGGYSTICLARSGGRVTTLEVSPEHAAVAKKNIARAGVAERVDVLVGPALDTLPELNGPFDLIFIDADKETYPEYLTWAIALSHSGTVIIADNVVRDGEIADPDSDDPRVQAVRRYIEALAIDSRLASTVVQTVGSKGYDGFALSIVR